MAEWPLQSSLNLGVRRPQYSGGVTTDGTVRLCNALTATRTPSSTSGSAAKIFAKARNVVTKAP